MADRHSSSQNTNYRHNDHRGHPNQNHQNYQNNSSHHQPQKSGKDRELQSFQMTNSFEASERVIFCKFNPLHVVSINSQDLHEKKECPDRKWNPGDKVAKYHDIKV